MHIQQVPPNPLPHQHQDPKKNPPSSPPPTAPQPAPTILYAQRIPSPRTTVSKYAVHPTPPFTRPLHNTKLSINSPTPPHRSLTSLLSVFNHTCIALHGAFHSRACSRIAGATLQRSYPRHAGAGGGQDSWLGRYVMGARRPYRIRFFFSLFFLRFCILLMWTLLIVDVCGVVVKVRAKPQWEAGSRGNVAFAFACV